MSFTEITGYCVLAEVRSGSNGVIPGTPECGVGKSEDSQAAARKRWDADVSDGIDSGWVPVELVVNADSTTAPVTWTVNGASPSPIVYTGASFGEILYFKLRAGVSGRGRKMSFRNIIIKFYTNGSDSTPAETGQISNPPIASNVGQPSATDVEAILDLGPEDSGYRKASLNADVRLESVDVPDITEIFGQVFVFTSTCA